MWNSSKRRRALKTLRQYGQPHRRWLCTGILATIGVVLCRLAMPWPLRGAVEMIFPGEDRGRLENLLPTWGEPILWIGASYVLAALGCGIFELFQRIHLRRFAAGTVRDLRGSAVRGIRYSRRSDAVSGDLVARIIGDSARVKAGLTGILVHGLQNGLLFLGVCGVLLWLSPWLGLVFLIAGIVVVSIGVRSSIPVASKAHKQRRKEGEYAAAIQEGIAGGFIGDDAEELNESSTKDDLKTTRLIALSSLLVHCVLAVTVSVALWMGTLQVRQGTLAPGEVFLFIAYALTVHRRLVQVGRQIARSGKVVACVNRVSALERKKTTVASRKPFGRAVSLQRELRLAGIKLARGKNGNGKLRLRRIDLQIAPGSRVAVVGEAAAGKSSLLQVLAGLTPADAGRVYWDGEKVAGRGRGLRDRVEYLPQDPTFPPMRIRKILRLSGSDNNSEQRDETLRLTGVRDLLRGFAKGINERVQSSSLSRSEARLLALAGILLGGKARVWVLDAPLGGMSRKRGARCLREIFVRAEKRTVIVSLTQLVQAHRFDRVVALRRGRIFFDGTPLEWKNRKRAAKHPTTEADAPKKKAQEVARTPRDSMVTSDREVM